MWKYFEIEVTVLEMRNDCDVFPHVYHVCPKANGSMIFLVSRNGHMMREKPTTSTSATNRLDWFSEVESDRVIAYSAVNWKRRIEVMEGTCRDLIPCGNCGLTTKAGLTQLRVGTWTASSAIGQDAEVYPNVSLDGRRAAIGRQRDGVNPGKGKSGMLDAASATFSGFFDFSG